MKTSDIYRGDYYANCYGDRFVTRMWNHRGWQKKKRKEKRAAKKREKARMRKDLYDDET